MCTTGYSEKKYLLGKDFFLCIHPIQRDLHSVNFEHCTQHSLYIVIYHTSEKCFLHILTVWLTLR